MFKVENQNFIYFFFVAIGLLALYVYGEWKRNKQLRVFGNIDLLKELMPSRSLIRQRLKFALVFVAFLLTILVCLRIRYASKTEGIVAKRNVEVVAVVDVSNSMLCKDVAPSRLDLVKQCLNRLLEQDLVSNFGLIEFAGVPVTKMPLSTDLGAAKMFINSMEPNEISTQGTSIGTALVQAKRCFSKKENVSRAIILFTDAENHEDDAYATAKDIVKNNDIQINVIGVGTEAGGMISLTEDADSVLDDQNGEPVITKLNVTLGQQIAKAGNGFFLNSASSEEIVNAIDDDLGSLAKNKKIEPSATAYADQFAFYAGIALLLLFLDCLIKERKSKVFTRLMRFFELKKTKSDENI